MADILIKSIDEDIHINNVGAFLFDLDGTLIDSLDLHIEAFQWILDKLGKDISKTQLEPLMGKTPQDIIEQFFSEMTQEELLDAATQKEDKLAEIIDSVYVYPGIEQFLQQLNKKGIKAVVISSTHRKLVEILLEKAGLLSYMHDIVSGDEVSNGKPDPEPFVRGIRKSGINGENTIAVGDSIHDFRSATGANANFVGILTGKTDITKFQEAGCKILIKDIDSFELLN